MTVKIQNASEIKNAKGEVRNKNAKPVICLDTGEVFTSATDAAEANGVTIYSISMNCLGKTMRSNGKRFCYIQNVNEHLDELTTVLQNLSDKANKYNEIVTQPKDAEPVTKAIEVHEEPIFKATEKPAVIYKAPEVRHEARKTNPLSKAKKRFNDSKIVSLFRAI